MLVEKKIWDSCGPDENGNYYRSIMVVDAQGSVCNVIIWGALSHPTQDDEGDDLMDDESLVTTAMHDNFVSALGLRVTPMVARAKPGVDGFPAAEWWSLLFKSRRIASWHEILERIGVTDASTFTTKEDVWRALAPKPNDDWTISQCGAPAGVFGLSLSGA